MNLNTRKKFYNNNSKYHNVQIPKHLWIKLCKIQELIPIHVSMTQVLSLVINSSREDVIKKVLMECGVKPNDME